MGNGHLVNEARLQQLEAASRAHVQQHPDDMNARLELAWCLLVQALYQAGQETAPAALAYPAAPTLPHPAAPGEAWFAQAVIECSELRSASRPPSVEGPRGSGVLLRECLRQAATVEQLSPRAEDHANARQLQSLVCLAGGEHAVVTSRQRLLNRALSLFADLPRQTEDPA